MGFTRFFLAAAMAVAACGSGCLLGASFDGSVTELADTVDADPDIVTDADSDVGADGRDGDRQDVLDSETNPLDTEDSGVDLNACGGANVLTFDAQVATPGDACGCDGTLICADSETLRCAGDQTNECGSCGPLPVVINAACGECQDGFWACGDEGPECLEATASANSCGGCENLTFAAETTRFGADDYNGSEAGFACERPPSNLGVFYCDELNALSCNDVDASGLCDSPGDLVSRVEPCGTCGRGTTVCDDGATSCNETAETAENACGGCSPLPASPGEECGRCGQYACSADNEALTCVENRNACGGCQALLPDDASPGADCTDGAGDPGTWVCSSESTLACEVDGTNRCGGTSVLDGEPGTQCGECGSGSWVCAGADRVVCDETLTINACGGCGILAGTPGETCMADHSWTCQDEGTVACVRTTWRVARVVTDGVERNNIRLPDSGLEVRALTGTIASVLNELGLRDSLHSLQLGIAALSFERTASVEGLPSGVDLTGNFSWRVDSLPGHVFPKIVLISVNSEGAQDDIWARQLNGDASFAALPALRELDQLTFAIYQPTEFFVGQGEGLCSPGETCELTGVCSIGGGGCVRGSLARASATMRLCTLDDDCERLGETAYCHDGTNLCVVPDPSAAACNVVGAPCTSPAQNASGYVCDIMAGICRNDCDNCEEGESCVTASNYRMDVDGTNPRLASDRFCISSFCDATRLDSCDGILPFDSAHAPCSGDECVCFPRDRSVGVCLRTGVAQIGEACGILTADDDPRYRCVPGAICERGVCEAPCVIGEASPCADLPTPSCVPGRPCQCAALSGAGTNSFVGVCRSECNAFDGECGESAACVRVPGELPRSPWACVAYPRNTDRLERNAPCSFAYNSDACLSGVCGSDTYGRGLACREFCEPMGERSCEDDGFCRPVPGSDVGLCETLCDPDASAMEPGANPLCGESEICLEEVIDGELSGICMPGVGVSPGETCDPFGGAPCINGSGCFGAPAEDGSTEYSCKSRCGTNESDPCPESLVCNGFDVLSREDLGIYCLSEDIVELSPESSGENCSAESQLCADGVSACLDVGDGQARCYRFCLTTVPGLFCSEEEDCVALFGEDTPTGGLCIPQ